MDTKHPMRRLIMITENTADGGRLDRAKHAGFDTDEPIYHGTTAGEFPAFKLNYRPGEQLVSGFTSHQTKRSQKNTRIQTNKDGKGNRLIYFVASSEKEKFSTPQPS